MTKLKVIHEPEEKKLFSLTCECETSIGDCFVIATTQEKAIELLSEQIDFETADWRIEEVPIPKRGLILEKQWV